MRIFLINTTCLLFVYVFTFIFYSQSYAYDNKIEFPDINIIKKDADAVIGHIFGKSFHSSSIYPKQIIVDLDKGKISGIMSIYTISTGLNDIISRIDSVYGQYKSFSNEKAQMYIWRIENKKVVIQISVNEENDIQLIIIPINEKR